MIKWINIPEETKRNAYVQVAEQLGMSAFAVEKDWWVSRTLEIIFQMEISQYLVFKGGTSLSKAWKLINRFSEDIDLVIDKEFFFRPNNDWSKKERTKLRKEAGAYTTGKFLTDLMKAFADRGFQGLQFIPVEAEDSDQDPRIIKIYYPNIISPPTTYVKAHIQLEIGCRSLREPYTLQTMGAILDEVYAEMDFAEPLFRIPCVNPERTFLEKIFLLHEEFHRPTDKIRVDRLSRHLYDIYHLSLAGIAVKAISDKELYETIVAHRYKFSRVGGVDYNFHNPMTLYPIPLAEKIGEWKTDYFRMMEEMIYENHKPSFEDLINNLNDLITNLRALNWKFELEFPKV